MRKNDGVDRGPLAPVEWVAIGLVLVLLGWIAIGLLSGCDYGHHRPGRPDASVAPDASEDPWADLPVVDPPECPDGGQ